MFKKQLEYISSSSIINKYTASTIHEHSHTSQIYTIHTRTHIYLTYSYIHLSKYGTISHEVTLFFLFLVLYLAIKLRFNAN